MRSPTLLVIAFLMLPWQAGAASKQITKETIASGGKERTYYLFVPKTVKPEAPAPLIVLLHGSKRNGLSLVEKWEKLAAKEGIILAGPDAANPEYWVESDDGPSFLYDLCGPPATC